MKPQIFPHDFPHRERPHRVYVAITNYCNRACPWCSMYSGRQRCTFLSIETIKLLLPKDGSFEVQLEGGEPTAHPQFWDIVALLRKERRCKKIVVSTNGSLLPRNRAELSGWLKSLGPAFTIKLSVNHHLLEQDPGLLELAGQLYSCMQSSGCGELVLNVRLRKGEADDDKQVVQRVEAAGLLTRSNVFFLQRYGRAKDRKEWEAPFLVGYNFTMINPDGAVFNQDMFARSEAMEALP